MNDYGIKRSLGRGKGVFAKRDFEKRDLIGVANVLTFSKDEEEQLIRTRLRDYVFGWSSRKTLALALSEFSFLNHSYQPNADCVQDTKKNTLTIRALKQIKKGDEIFINYNGNPKSKSELWFDEV